MGCLGENRGGYTFEPGLPRRFLRGVCRRLFPVRMNTLLNTLHANISVELGRVIASFVVVLFGIIANRIVTRVITTRSNAHPTRNLRQRLVWGKNLVLACVLVLIAGIWASRIAGVALSLAAVAGAVLIVSKELVSCFLGYLVLALARPYDIGDFIEIGTHSGRVVDFDVLSTTLAETGTVNQLTGKTITVPHSMLLTTPVRNSTATGQYIVDLYRIVVPFGTPLDSAERAALEAAREACDTWREAANQHFAHIEQKSLLDLPSAKEKVLWEAGDGKHMGLVVRFACPADERVATEQAIFRGFWQRLGGPAARPVGRD